GAGVLGQWRQHSRQASRRLAGCGAKTFAALAKDGRSSILIWTTNVEAVRTIKPQRPAPYPRCFLFHAAGPIRPAGSSRARGVAQAYSPLECVRRPRIGWEQSKPPAPRPQHSSSPQRYRTPSMVWEGGPRVPATRLSFDVAPISRCQGSADIGIKKPGSLFWG